MSIYAISDIHRRIDLLKEVGEDIIDFSKGDIFITCGDYVDGDLDSDSYLTLKYLMELQKMYPKQVIVLFGNHDQWFLDWLSGKKRKD